MHFYKQRYIFIVLAADIMSSEEQPEEDIAKSVELETEAPKAALEVAYRDTITIEKQEEEIPEKVLAAEMKPTAVEVEVYKPKYVQPETEQIPDFESYKESIEITPKEKPIISEVEIPQHKEDTEITVKEIIDKEKQSESVEVSEEEHFKETIELSPKEKPKFTEGEIAQPSEDIEVVTVAEILEVKKQPEVVGVPEKETFKETIEISPKEKPKVTEVEIPQSVEVFGIASKELAVEVEEKSDRTEIPEKESYRETVEIPSKDEPHVIEVEIPKPIDEMKPTFKEVIEVQTQLDVMDIPEERFRETLELTSQVLEVFPEEITSIFEAEIPGPIEEKETLIRESFKYQKQPSLTDIPKEETIKQTTEIIQREVTQLIEIETSAPTEEMIETVREIIEVVSSEESVVSDVEIPAPTQETVEIVRQTLDVEKRPQSMVVAEADRFQETIAVTAKTPSIIEIEVPVPSEAVIAIDETTKQLQTPDILEEDKYKETLELSPKEPQKVEEEHVSLLEEEAQPTLKESIETEKQSDISEDEIAIDTAEFTPKPETIVSDVEISAPMMETIELVRETVDVEMHPGTTEEKLQELMEITDKIPSIAEVEISVPKEEIMIDKEIVEIEKLPQIVGSLETEKYEEVLTITPEETPFVEEVEMPVPLDEMQAVSIETKEQPEKADIIEKGVHTDTLVIAPTKVPQVEETEVTVPSEEIQPAGKEVVEVELVLTEEAVAEEIVQILEGEETSTPEMEISAPTEETVEVMSETLDAEKQPEISTEASQEMLEIADKMPSIVQVEVPAPLEQTELSDFTTIEIERKPESKVRVQEEIHIETLEITPEETPKVEEVEIDVPTDEIPTEIGEITAVETRTEIPVENIVKEVVEIKPTKISIVPETEIPAPSEEVVEIFRQTFDVKQKPERSDVSEETFQENIEIVANAPSIVEVEIPLISEETTVHDIGEFDMHPETADITEDEKYKETIEIASKAKAEVEIPIPMSVEEAQTHAEDITEVEEGQAKDIHEEITAETIESAPEEEAATLEVEIPAPLEERVEVFRETIETEESQEKTDIADLKDQDMLEAVVKTPSNVEEAHVPSTETIFVQEITEIERAPLSAESTEEKRHKEILEISPRQTPTVVEMQIPVSEEETRPLTEEPIQTEIKTDIAGKEIMIQSLDISPKKESEVPEAEIPAPTEERVETVRETIKFETGINVDIPEEDQFREAADITIKMPSTAKSDVFIPAKETEFPVKEVYELEIQRDIPQLLEEETYQETLEISPKAQPKVDDIELTIPLEIIEAIPEDQKIREEEVETEITAPVEEKIETEREQIHVAEVSADQELLHFRPDEYTQQEIEAPKEERIEFIRDTVTVIHRETTGITVEQDVKEFERVDQVPETLTSVTPKEDLVEEYKETAIIQKKIPSDVAVAESEELEKLTVESEVVVPSDVGEKVIDVRTEIVDVTPEIPSKVPTEKYELLEVSLDDSVKEKIEKLVEETIELAKEEIGNIMQAEAQISEHEEKPILHETADITLPETEAEQSLDDVTFEMAVEKDVIPADVLDLDKDEIDHRIEQVIALDVDRHVKAKITTEESIADTEKVGEEKLSRTEEEIVKDTEELVAEIPSSETEHLLAEESKETVPLERQEAADLPLEKISTESEKILQIPKERPSATEPEDSIKVPVKIDKLSAEAPEREIEEMPQKEEISPIEEMVTPVYDETLVDISAQVIEQYAQEITREILESATVGNQVPSEISDMDIDVDTAAPSEIDRETVDEVSLQVVTEGKQVTVEEAKPSELKPVIEELKPEQTIVSDIEIEADTTKVTAVEVDILDKPEISEKSLELEVEGKDLQKEEVLILTHEEKVPKDVEIEADLPDKEEVSSVGLTFGKTPEIEALEIDLGEKPKSEETEEAISVEVDIHEKAKEPEEISLEVPLEEIPVSVDLEFADKPAEEKKKTTAEEIVLLAEPKVQETKPTSVDISLSNKPEEKSEVTVEIPAEVKTVLLDVDITEQKKHLTEEIKIPLIERREETTMEIEIAEKPVPDKEIPVVLPVEEKTEKVETQEMDVSQKEIIPKEVQLSVETEEIPDTKATSVDIALEKKPTDKIEVAAEIQPEEKPVPAEIGVKEKPVIKEEISVEIKETSEKVSLDISLSEEVPEGLLTGEKTHVAELEIGKEPAEITSRKLEEITLDIDKTEKPKPTEKVSIEIPVEEKPEKVSLGITVEEKTTIEERVTKVVETIEFAPKFVKTLKDITIPEGDMIELIVEFQSHPDSDVSWYIDNQLVKESPDFMIIVEKEFSKLTISDVFLEDEGEYKVIVENPLGSVTSICYLTVIGELLALKLF